MGANGKWRAWLAALVCGVAGCGVVELAPDKPALRGARVVPTETSELVVVIRGGSLGYRARWVIYVDGVARAWMPTEAGFTRIRITPGQHDVEAGFRTRDLNIALIPLPPWSNEIKARRAVVCQPALVCGFAAGVYLDMKRSWVTVDAEVLEEGEIDAAISGLPFVAPDE